MNLDSVMDFVKEHPKELGIAAAGLIGGALLFRRTPNDEPMNDTDDDTAYSNDAPTPPSNGYSSGATGQYLPPAPVIQQVTNKIDYDTRGKVPADIAKIYKCPNKDAWKRVWGRDANANNVVCRNKTTGKDILPTEIYRNGKWVKNTKAA